MKYVIYGFDKLEYRIEKSNARLLLTLIFVLFWTILPLHAVADDNENFTLISAAFPNKGKIPKKYTCEGADIPPPLAWKGVPRLTRSLVLIVDDPDAPDPKAPQKTWVHWVIYNIPPEVKSLPEGVLSRNLPTGTEEGLNDWRRPGYGGPCPPIGRHRYFHKLYALDIILKDLGLPTKAELEKAMAGHIIAKAELIGTYEKSD